MSIEMIKTLSRSALTLAVDAMGGDDAPDMVIGGVALALKKDKQVHFKLFGIESQLRPLIQKYKLDQSRIEVIHAPEVISGSTKPSAAIRGSKNSSMRLAIEAVARGEADAVVSAGNTGAYMALSKLILKTLPGIDRPAIATTLPTMKDPSLMLDLGANVECSTDNLVQFAIMGQVYAQQVMKINAPSVALLNVGAEALKGNAIIKATHTLLKCSEWMENFYGFVEGDDILSGKVDVIVTDGFTGNVALKTAEGTFKTINKFMKSQFSRSFMSKLSYVLGRSVFSSLRSQFDPRYYNGAPFLGLAGISVKSHGGTDAMGFSYALFVAADMVRKDVNTLIGEGLDNWHETIQIPVSNTNEEEIQAEAERELKQA